MPIDRKLLEILRCPVTKLPVNMLSKERIRKLNQLIAEGNVSYVDGSVVDKPLEEALVTENDRTIYRIDDSIPIMLEDQGIPTEQFKEFS
ncbi:Trm112 family protein [Pseudomonadota bacterium]